MLACVAMFRREKNQQELVEIAAGLPPGLDWQLWLAGEGPELAACRALAARLRSFAIATVAGVALGMFEALSVWLIVVLVYTL